MAFVFFEDFEVGETREYGDYLIEEPELVAFAATYDAQPFHLDAEAAQGTILGGLAASGWQVCSALMRMMIDAWVKDSSCLAGTGVEDNRWLAPVRAGDRLAARTTTVEKADLRARPDAGVVKFATSLRNQAGQEVMTQTVSMLFGRRERLSGAPSAGARRPPAPGPVERIDDPAAAMPEDFARARVGAYAELGETLFTADLIRDYALKYDPAPFHVDEAAGRAHMFGGMSAAGLHTACLWMSHFIATRQRLGGVVSRASPGFRDMLWRRPVLVGDRITFSTQVVAKRETSKPGLGLITSRNQGVNQRGEVALDFFASLFAPVEPA
ncbi:MaoC/PaaZ C-terminal domain-containing protein [Rhodoblastus sp.]|uniref:MaoC/PaaZ C-terminal domain-containing protein n=1 Tax=Rhodoblastus sp. TaxID=1962975 RepID=UPI002629D16C|nr:MaoC/PaaZ C-terminal domain-containing protein [Rhodoblastus sp.]